MFATVGKRAMGGSPSTTSARQLRPLMLTLSQTNGQQPSPAYARLYSATASTLKEAQTKRASSPSKAAASKPKANPANKEQLQQKKAADKEKRQEKQKADKEKAVAKALRAKEKKAADSKKAEVTELKSKILTPPKAAPESSYVLLFTDTVAQASKSGERVSVVDLLRESAAKYKTLDASTREAFDRQASENKAKNASNFNSWVLSHTPQQIYDSNRASQHLQRLGKVKKARKIADPRTPKWPMAPHIVYAKERHESGALKGNSIIESNRILNQEWKDMADAQRKPYHDRAQEMKAQWEKDMTALFGTTAPAQKST